MTNFGKNQLTILLAYYYFDYKKDNQNRIQRFTSLFNAKFNTDINVQNITYLMGLFKSVDPSYKSGIQPPENNDIYLIWKYYVSEDRIKQLRELYVLFKKKDSPHVYVNNDNDLNEQIDTVFETALTSFGGDKPKPLYQDNSNSAGSSYKRDVLTSYNALKNANFKCEYNTNHESFIRRKAPIRYTEGHHLVPLEFQHQFNVNLDVEANIVSLCSNCHNNLHYGKDYDKLLKKLYEDRKDRLETCGIIISFEELLEMYK